MKPKTSAEGGLTHSSLKGKSIWIIGPRRLQNELLANLLSGKTGAACFCGENVNQALDLDANRSRPGLFLFDCLGKDREEPIAPLRPEEQRLVSPHLVALFNVHPGLGIEEQALREGIRGFFYENDPHELLQKGVRAIFNGELWVSRDIMSRCILEDKGKVKAHLQDAQALTTREMEILSLLAIGSTNEEIGATLCISINTVKTHVYNIFHKINVPNRLQAALWAAKHL